MRANRGHRRATNGSRARVVASASAAAVALALSFVAVAPSAAAQGGAASAPRFAAPASPATGTIGAHDGRFWLGSSPIVLQGATPYGGLGPNGYNQIGSWGMNLIRLPIRWSSIEPSPPVEGGDGTWTHTYDATYVRWIKDNIADASSAGMYVILDSYKDKSSFWPYPAWQYTAGFNSHGVTYPQTDEGITKAAADFWTDPLRQGSMRSMWVHVATELVGVQGIAGYEILNEPQTGNLPLTHATTQTVLDSQLQIATAIRAQDPTRMILFMTRGSTDIGLANADLSGFAALGNVAYDMHDYFGARWGDGLMREPSNLSYLEGTQHLFLSTDDSNAGVSPYIGTLLSHLRYIQQTVDKLAAWRFPLIIGEFGDWEGDPGIYTYLGEVTTALQRTGVSWAVNYGIMIDDQRQLTPYAYLVQGIIQR